MPRLPGPPRSEHDKAIAEAEEKEFARQVGEARKSGRYPLPIAAELIARAAGLGVSAERMQERLMDAARTVGLTVYMHGQTAEWDGDMQIVSLLEAYADDLNIWLRFNEPKIPSPFATPPARQDSGVEISKAPPPITPIRGAGATIHARKSTAKAPTWRKWVHIPEVQVWQACALSLNIEPDSMQPCRGAWMVGPGSGPFFEDESFPSDEVKEEFKLRQEVLLANLFNRALFSPGILNMGTPGNHGVRLSEFAAWVVSVPQWTGLPPELLALAQKPNTAIIATTLHLPADTKFVPIGEIAGLLARAKHPDGGILWAASVNYHKQELDTAIRGGEIQVFEPATMRPIKGQLTSLPAGGSPISNALVPIADVQQFGRKVAVEIALDAPNNDVAARKSDTPATTPKPDAASLRSALKLGVEPRLQKGKNARHNVKAWIAWQARQLVKGDDKIENLAERLQLLAQRYGYESERKPLDIGNITKMIPAGLTGGRAKNTGRPKK